MYIFNRGGESARVELAMRNLFHCAPLHSTCDSRLLRTNDDKNAGDEVEAKEEEAA